MAWHLLNAWVLKVLSASPKEPLSSCPSTRVCFSSGMETLDTARTPPGAVSITCRPSGITTCKVQVRLQAMLVPF